MLKFNNVRDLIQPFYFYIQSRSTFLLLHTKSREINLTTKSERAKPKDRKFGSKNHCNFYNYEKTKTL